MSVLNVTIIPQRIIARVIGPGINTTAVINRAGAARVVLLGTQGPAGAPGASGGQPAVKQFLFGDASPALVLAMSAPLIVLRANVVITQPFNGAGATLAVGTAGLPQSIAAATQINAAFAAEYETNPNLLVSSNVLLTITPGAGCTQGAGWIVLQTANP